MHRFFLLACLLALAAPLRAQEFTSSNLPIIVIDTEGQTIPDEPKINSYLGIIWNGEGARNNVSDPHNHYSGRMGIEIRGNSSQMFPKKSYGFETRDALGENLNVPLLGLPEENDWILYAPYSDKSLIRNAFTYDLGRELGHYASRVRFCEVILNGDYIGVYLLLEKIKQDSGRVDIAKLEPEDISGDALTGGYIVRIDKDEYGPNDHWTSPHPPFVGAPPMTYVKYGYYDPAPDEITSEQRAYISGHVTAFEDVMAGPDYNAPLTGYHSWLDIDSFVEFIIVNELSRNVDGYHLSTYLYKDRDSADGRLVMGPLWDFNLGYGNADYFDAWLTEGFNYTWEDPWSEYQNCFWWEKLMADPIFLNRLALRWRDLRLDGLSSAGLAARIGDLATRLDEAQARNFERWDILGEYVWPNWFVGETWQEELDFLTGWIADRMVWLDAAFPAPRAEVHWVRPDMAGAGAEPGETLTLPLTTWIEWQSGAETIEFATADPDLALELVGDSLRITALSGGEHEFLGLAREGGEIVDLSPAYTFSASASGIVITEIMYNPSAGAECGDWVELYNNSDAPIDLGLWTMSDDNDGHAFMLPAGTVLAARDWLILAREPSAFQTVYGFPPDLGPFGFGFGDDDQVRLFDASDLLRDMVAYDNATPWPGGADGLGYSLSLIDPDLNNALAGSWEASSALGGTPGEANGDLTAISDFETPPTVIAFGNHPNPFNPDTRIGFTLPRGAEVELSIHDGAGRRVATLLRGPLSAGRYQTTWRGCADDGSPLATGLYFARLTCGDESVSRKMMLLK